MAFLNKIGNILKQAVGKNTNLELSASNASLFQTIRSMSSSKLFVGGLSYGTDESSLKEAFAQYGEVIEARIILDRDTGRSRGFGFISFPSSEEATSAMQSMDGQDLHGRRIRVNYATEKRRDGFGGGYGGGGGGYAAGNYGGGGGYNSPGGGGGFSGGYNSAGGGGYNYGGEGGNFAGAGGYPINNYCGEGGGFSSGNSPAGGYGSYGGGGSNYGNNSSSPIEGANYGSSPSNNYSGQSSSFSGGYGGGNSGNDFVGAPSNNNGFTTAGLGVSSETSYNGGQEQLSADQGTQCINEDFGKEASEVNYRDDDDEPKDYANTRG